MCAALAETNLRVRITVEPEQSSLDRLNVHVAKSREEQRFLLTVAYAANLPDIGVARDGHIDYASKEVVEHAAWSFVRKGCKLGLWHMKGTTDPPPAEVVESSIYRNPEPWINVSPDGTVQKVCEGDWLLGMVLEPETWQMYKAGLITGVSPQGPARRNNNPSEAALAGLRSRNG